MLFGGSRQFQRGMLDQCKVRVLRRTKILIDYVRNNGVKYIIFRSYYELASKLGIKKLFFPVRVEECSFYHLSDWKKNTPKFIISGNEIKGLKRNPTKKLKDNYSCLQKGIYTFFSNEQIQLSNEDNWVTTMPDSKPFEFE